MTSPAITLAGFFVSTANMLEYAKRQESSPMPLPSPSGGESKADFMDRCIPMAAKESDSSEQAVAICATQFDTARNERSRVPPKSAQNNAQKVLDWRDEYGDEVSGMTEVGWRRANQLAKGQELSWDVISRMSQFSRHRKNAEVAEEYKDEPWKDNGYVAWLGWGGTTGIEWAQSMMDSKQENNSRQIRVNVSTRVSNASIKEGERNGRKVMIVPSATLPFNVVMNGGLYPEEEIRNGYGSLEKTLAPIGHPMVNGQYVSAMDPEAINGYHVGAWNENVRLEGNRVKLDKIIDVERAQSSDKGRDLLEAINKGEAIHTSTGLLLEREEVEGNNAYDWIARNMRFDHDAILFGEPGAATPVQGVGMMVNGQEVEVQNVSLDMLDDEIEHFGQMLFELVEKREKVSKWSEVKGKVVDFMKTLVQSEDEQATGLSVNRNEEDDMSVTKQEFEAFKAEVLAAVNAKGEDKPVDELAEQVKALNARLDAQEEDAKQKAKAAHDAAVNKVVEAEILEKEVAEAMETNALEALAEKFGKPGNSFGVNGRLPTGDTDQLSTELPE